jgi:hypothetical protein
MKKLALALALLTTASVASAHGWEHGGYRGGGYGYGHGYYHGGGYNWLPPAIIGGVIGYELSQPRTVYVQPPVVYQQPQIIYTQPTTPNGYHTETILDAGCNCYRTVLVQN